MRNKQKTLQVSVLESRAKQILKVYERSDRVDDIIATTAAEENGNPVIEVDFGDDVIESWTWQHNPGYAQAFPGSDQIDERYKVWVRS